MRRGSVPDRSDELSAPIMTTLRVELGERGYDIVVTSEDGAGVGPFARGHCAGSLAFVVGDANTRAHTEQVEQALQRAGFRTATAILPPGEAQKDLRVAAGLYDRLAELQ